MSVLSEKQSRRGKKETWIHKVSMSEKIAVAVMYTNEQKCSRNVLVSLEDSMV